MRYPIAALIPCLVLTSCILSDGGSNTKSSYRLISITESTFEAYAINSSFVMDCCMALSDYLSSDMEITDDAWYSDLYFESGDTSYVVGKSGEVLTFGSDFYSDVTQWRVYYDCGQYTVKYLGNDSWEVCGTDLEDSYYQYKSRSDYKSVFTLLGRDSDGFCRWQCQSEALYREDDTYSLSYSSDMTFYRDTDVSWSSSFTYSLVSTIVCSGTVYVRFLVDGKESDWCKLTYEDGEISEYETSVDDEDLW